MHFGRCLVVLAVWCGVLAALATADAAGRPLKRRAPITLVNESLKPEPLVRPDPDKVKASCGGKYRELLRKIAVPDDKASYTEFHDYGFYPACASYGGHKDLPEGYWVYVFPHWYIWKECGEPARPQR